MMHVVYLLGDRKVQLYARILRHTILCAQSLCSYCVRRPYGHTVCGCLCVDVVYLLVENWLLTIDPAGDDD